MAWMWSATQLFFSGILFVSHTKLDNCILIVGPFCEWGTLINSQNSPIFRGPGETNLFLPSPAGLMEFPNVLSLEDLGAWVVHTQADPGILLIRTGGRKPSLP